MLFFPWAGKQKRWHDKMDDDDPLSLPRKSRKIIEVDRQPGAGKKKLLVGFRKTAGLASLLHSHSPGGVPSTTRKAGMG